MTTKQFFGILFFSLFLKWDGVRKQNFCEESTKSITKTISASVIIGFYWFDDNSTSKGDLFSCQFLAVFNKSVKFSETEGIEIPMMVHTKICLIAAIIRREMLLFNSQYRNC